MTNEERAREIVDRSVQIHRPICESVECSECMGCRQAIDLISEALDAKDREIAAEVLGAEKAIEAAAQLHENVDVRCAHEHERGDPGAGAIGSVIEYRDAIRALSPSSVVAGPGAASVPARRGSLPVHVPAAPAAPAPCATCGAKDAEIARLREALAPFAEINPVGDLSPAEPFVVAWRESLIYMGAEKVAALGSVSAGDFRRAAAAMGRGER